MSNIEYSDLTNADEEADFATLVGVTSGTVPIPVPKSLILTDLTWTAETSTVASSTGTDAVVTVVDGSNPGLMVSADKTKLDGIESGATADQSGAEILAALLAVDGDGSGLDADLLDGLTPVGLPVSTATQTALDDKVDDVDGTIGSSVTLAPYSDPAAPTGDSVPALTILDDDGSTVRAEIRASDTGLAIGIDAHKKLTTGADNMAMGNGAQALLTTGDGNVNLGNNGQAKVTSGANNTNIGTNGQGNLTTGNFNFNLGANGQVALTTGAGNVSMGNSGQAAITDGAKNVNIGNSGQKLITTASNNVSIGHSGQAGITIGASNTNVGTQGQDAPGGTGANATTTGSRQTTVGMQTGQSSTTQIDDGTAVGYRALFGANNATALGSGATANHSAAVALGSNTTTTAASQVRVGPRHFEMVEITAPAAGATDSARLFARDNGSGKTQLCVIFATGAIQVIATQP